MKETKFKHTEIGLIPEDWEVKKISEVCRNFTGLTYNPENIANYGTLVLRSSNIQNNELTFMDNVYVDMEIPNRAIAKAGDVLVCVRNGSSQLIGKSALITPEAEGMAFGAFMTVLRTSSIDNVYLLQSWRHKRTQDQIHETFGATINQITSKDFNRILIPIPPNKEEQSRIATALYDIDTLIRNLDRTIEKKKNIRQGAMEQLLSGKKRLPGFKGEWEQVEIGNVCKRMKRGEVLSAAEMNTGVFPVIAAGTEPAGHCDKYNRNPMTISVSGSGANAGFVAFHKNRIFATDCFTIGASEEYDVEFIYYVLKMRQKEIFKLQTGGAQPHVYPRDLSSMSVYYTADLQEQRAIADTLTAMDDEIAVLQMERDKYANIRSGMMDDLLTGAKRL